MPVTFLRANVTAEKGVFLAKSINILITVPIIPTCSENITELVIKIT